MTAAPFAALDAVLIATNAALFGQPVSLVPMAQAAAGPNAARVADPDRTRIETTGVRAEWSERVQTSDNGMGRSAVRFSTAISGVKHMATLRADLAWSPRAGDRLIWADRPLQEYEIVEVLPDGLTGVDLVVKKV